MRKLMLSIPVTVVVLLAASMAQGPPPGDPESGDTCFTPPSMGFGSAMKLQAYASAMPGGENRRQVDKRCFSPEFELSDQKSLDSTGDHASATTSYSYHLDHGVIGLEQEVKASGHLIPGKQGGSGDGMMNLYVWWSDAFTLHSATTKPIPPQETREKGVKETPIDPSQVVDISVRLLNDGNNQCSGAGGTFYYKTFVTLIAAGASNRTMMGGQQQYSDTNWSCKDQSDRGTIQVLLAHGKFRVELMVMSVMGGSARHEVGQGVAGEEGDAKVKLGDYHFCILPTKGPADLTISSASGIDYTCKKK